MGIFGLIKNRAFVNCQPNFRQPAGYYMRSYYLLT